MEVKITSTRANPLLKRKEVVLKIENGSRGKTPGRLEVRNVVASELKIGKELVFVQELVTKTGTNTTIGSANVYETIEQAKLVEPKHIIERNNPKPKEEAKQ